MLGFHAEQTFPKSHQTGSKPPRWDAKAAAAEDLQNNYGHTAASYAASNKYKAWWSQFLFVVVIFMVFFFSRGIS